MDIIVCIKQVPGSSNVEVDPVSGVLKRSGVPSKCNPYDLYAIEAALSLAERFGGSVECLTMGPPQAENALREAIALGVDQGILVSDRAFAGSDTWATSYTLALALRKIGDYTLILGGKQASDGDTAQVGPGIAAHLDLPQITYTRKIESLDGQRIVAERLLEDGFEVIEAPLPCVLTVVKEINEPRLPSLKGKLAARKAQIIRWQAGDLGGERARFGLDGSPTKVVRIFTPAPRPGGIMFRGEPAEIAPQLAEKLREAVVAAQA